MLYKNPSSISIRIFLKYEAHMIFKFWVSHFINHFVSTGNLSYTKTHLEILIILLEVSIMPPVALLYFSTRFRLGDKVNFLGYQDLLFDLNKRLLLWFLAKRTLLTRNPVFSA